MGNEGDLRLALAQLMTARTDLTSAAATRLPLVLVVDDSRAQRRILALQLSRWGYVVTEAESGDEAMALVDARHDGA